MMADARINIEKIKEARVAKDISVKEMSEKLGYKSHVAYFRKEDGTRNFTTNDVYKVAKILDLKLDDIFLQDKLPNR